MKISVPIHPFAVSHEYHSKNGVVYKPYNLLGPDTDQFITEVEGLIKRAISKDLFVDRRGIVHTNTENGNKLVVGLFPEYNIVALRGFDPNGNQTIATFFELQDLETILDYDNCAWYNVEPGNYYVEEYTFA